MQHYVTRRNAEEASENRVKTVECIEKGAKGINTREAQNYIFLFVSLTSVQ